MRRLGALLALIVVGIGALLELAFDNPRPKTRVVSFSRAARRRARAREAETVPASAFPPTEALP